MKINFTIEELAEWVEDLIDAAKDDHSFSIAWFKGTENSPFSIIGGWESGFSEDYSDIFCISKSEPKYAMSIKIAVNNGPYAYTDFEAMDMPTDKFGEVDDTCVPLEWDDNPEAVAAVYIHEWERIMSEHGEEY
jgi:hypothetical protein